MAKREDFSAELERAIKLVPQHAAELLRRPDVVAVSAGAERRGGRPTGRAAIVVTVRRKLPAEELATRGYEPLPDEIDGVPLDVIEHQKPVESDEVQAAVRKAIGAKQEVVPDLLTMPNVTGVGVGYRQRKGEFTDEITIQVFVREKVSPSTVTKRGWTLIPERIGDVPTDVIQAGPFTRTVAPSGPRGDRRDPLIGGLSVGHQSEPFAYGTLGAIVFDADNNAMALSNQHVLSGNIGDTVHQPSPVGLDDSLDVELQLDVCNPLNFLRLDTPDTLGGTILAGAALAAAAAAVLSDTIDPTREGQDATAPPGGALTLEEYTKVEARYRQFPLPGTPFKVDVDWEYERRTTHGVMKHADQPQRINEHVLAFHRLFADRALYSDHDRIRLFGVLVPAPGSKTHCRNYHCVAILHPKHLDRSYPVLLRWTGEWIAGPRLAQEFLNSLPNREIEAREREIIVAAGDRLCVYYGELATAGLPSGTWSHWMHVQTVNNVPPGTDPLDAARFIGGLPVSNHYRRTLDIACGPFVFDDDGTFDIELISIAP